MALGNLGVVYKEMGNMEAACRTWRESLRIYEEINSPEAERVKGRLEENC